VSASAGFARCGVCGCGVVRGSPGSGRQAEAIARQGFQEAVGDQGVEAAVALQRVAQVVVRDCLDQGGSGDRGVCGPQRGALAVQISAPSSMSRGGGSLRQSPS
jgi:hypothetical protein